MVHRAVRGRGRDDTTARAATLRKEIPVLLTGRHRVDDHLLASVELEHNGLQQPGMSVEAQPKFTTRRTIVEWFDPQCPFGGLFGVFASDTALESARMDLHAAKCASAARITSERVTCFSSNVAFRGFDQSTPGGSGRWLWI